MYAYCYQLILRLISFYLQSRYSQHWEEVLCMFFWMKMVEKRSDSHNKSRVSLIYFPEQFATDILIMINVPETGGNNLRD